jgi:hypothetical protein
MSTYPVNVFAPQYFQGVNVPPATQTGYEPRPFTYIYNPPNNQLTASQVLQGQAVAIDVDSDFLLFGWYISLFTGAFQIQLADSTGYYLSSGFINSGAISQSSADPTVFSPSHGFPAGGKIVINIQDLSVATNPLQIAFVGEKLFRVTQQGQ